MPAQMRNRHNHQNNSSSNHDIDGAQIHLDKQSELLAKKKLTLIEQEENNNFINNHVNLTNGNDKVYGRLNGVHNEENNDNNDDKNEVFSDMKTTVDSLHKKLNSSQDDQIFIFGRAQQQNNESFRNSIRDQFAESLLKLQADLDGTSDRLNELEARISAIQQRQQRQQSSTESLNKSQGKFRKLLDDPVVSKLIFLGWPILVFVTMRAIERRSIK